MDSVKLKHSLLLLLTALIWGTAFVAQSSGGNACGPYTFNCIRSIIGAVILLPVIFLLEKKGFSDRRPKTKQDKRNLICGGVLCGIALCLASNLQQLGLYFGASAGKAGFLTACYILIVPILGIFLKKKCGINIWIGVAFTLIGLYLLCSDGSFSFTLPDLLLLLCALIFSFHILIIDHFSPLVDGVRMSCIQFFVCGLLSVIPMFIFDMNHSLSGVASWIPSLMTWSAWIPILYAGFLSCGVGYTLQIIGQEGLNPAIASLLMSLESVFSVIAGWIILGETMGPRELIGCGMIFIAIVLAQIPLKNKK
ncbi:DMT family transporter [uncultured Eubacterium sp.]|uniref:DMT family transporter n=1 Tax=uncultured Eubacterium sp. TaxID=165185 RepID=UPI0026710C28|nr:DMT family transporter [uncultured Eubacterium sp.]